MGKHSRPRNRRYATQFTLTGVLDMTNRKPYRSAALKARAKVEAKKDKDGTFRCNTVPVLYHRQATHNEF